MTVVVALLLAAVHSAVRSDTTSPDRALADLMSRDSASHIVLTSWSVEFAFTDAGARRVRRATDSAAAAHPQPAARSEWFDGAALARSITDRVVRGMHVIFPIETIREVRTDRDMLTVCFTTRAPDVPSCDNNKRFVFTGTTPADVQRFAAAVEQARTRAR